MSNGKAALILDVGEKFENEISLSIPSCFLRLADSNARCLRMESTTKFP